MLRPPSVVSMWARTVPSPNGTPTATTLMRMVVGMEGMLASWRSRMPRAAMIHSSERKRCDMSGGLCVNSL